MATTAVLVFRNHDCLSLFVSSNTTLLELQTLLFKFFPKSAFLDWGCGFSKDAAYTRTFTVVEKGALIEIKALKSTFEGGGGKLIGRRALN